ncbi:hypothetical protein SAMN05445060_4133 [Williamsia sterculiae]|uniref:Uncharacterized protein n=1 Tax=Williamsia sterculiae TaxID=1344003 RepID=A0A1N7HF80_9NOCA|nr:hypothetical protein SAMN05445060_4133 [Williamsia sterculiae]
MDAYLKRGLIPGPDATCSVGPLWSGATLNRAREQPIASLAAVVPVDRDNGFDDADEAGVYMCPDRSAHFIGWTTPSIIGLVTAGSDRVAQWHEVRACARFDGPVVRQMSTDDAAQQKRITDATARRRNTNALTVYLLSDPLAYGQIRVGASATTGGLQRARLLARRGQKVGAPGNWLTLPTKPTTTPLPEFVLPVLDDAFPK